MLDEIEEPRFLHDPEAADVALEAVVRADAAARRRREGATDDAEAALVVAAERGDRQVGCLMCPFS